MNKEFADAAVWIAFFIFIYKMAKLFVDRKKPLQTVVKYVTEERCSHSYYLSWNAYSDRYEVKSTRETDDDNNDLVVHVTTDKEDALNTIYDH